MKITGLIVLLLQILVTSPSQTSFQLVSGKVEFKIKNLGINVNGTMKVNSITFKQPSANPSTWSLEGTADPATISTGIALRDKHLKKPDYFDVENYPGIHLRSIEIQSTGKDNYKGSFTLTLKTTSKNITIPFSIKKNGNRNIMEGEFTINRLDYGLGEESTILSNDVKIKVSVVLKGGE